MPSDHADGVRQPTEIDEMAKISRTFPPVCWFGREGPGPRPSRGARTGAAERQLVGELEVAAHRQARGDAADRQARMSRRMRTR